MGHGLRRLAGGKVKSRHRSGCVNLGERSVYGTVGVGRVPTWGEDVGWSGSSAYNSKIGSRQEMEIEVTNMGKEGSLGESMIPGEAESGRGMIYEQKRRKMSKDKKGGEKIMAVRGETILKAGFTQSHEVQ